VKVVTLEPVSTVTGPLASTWRVVGSTVQWPILTHRWNCARIAARPQAAGVPPGYLTASSA